IPLEDAFCDGCLGERVFLSCRECHYGFRRCAREKQVTWCFQCPEFPYQRLKDFGELHLVDNVTHLSRLYEDLGLLGVKSLKDSLEDILEYTAYKRPLTALQERFLEFGIKGFSTAEIVELLLVYPDLPPRECHELASRVMERFGTLRALVAASPEELRQVGVSPSGIIHISFVREIASEVLKEEIMEPAAYHSPKEIFEYLSYAMRDLEDEVFKVIFLNNRGQIIDIVDLFKGTLQDIPIRPREIVESAIKHKATALVFVHNHPSGDPAPSRSDKSLTRDLVFIGNILQIKVLDHIIVGDNVYCSFAEEGLIDKYRDSFLNLRIRSAYSLTPCKKRITKQPLSSKS
ncbi:DNA repair protein RadC, partial [Chloroflexota bacterium]